MRTVDSMQRVRLSKVPVDPGIRHPASVPTPPAPDPEPLESC
jgi:hypothetical protein